MMASLALAIFVLFAISVIRGSPWWLGADADAYYLAAERLRSGEPLYAEPPAAHPDSYFRYAPWFAVAFVPLTFIPREVAVAAFSAFALACCALVLLPLSRRIGPESLGLLLLIAPALVHFSFMGNVQAPLVAAVMYLPRQWIWIAVAASLKFAPLALVLPYAAARQWGTTARCLALTAALALPILLFDLGGYVTDTGHQIGTWDVSPWVTIGLGAAGSVATVFLARRSFVLGMAAAAGTVILASPYLIVGYLSWLLVPLRPRDEWPPLVPLPPNESAIGASTDTA